jgi:histidinol-phosphate aminotransferase
MSKISELVPERVKALPAYVPGKAIKQAEAESGVRAIKLASNENPFGPSPLALKAIRDTAASVNQYPDNDAGALRIRIAELHNIPSENVIVTAGSTPLLDILARTLLGPGLNAITSERSFIVYPIVARGAGGELRTVPMKNDGYDLDAIAAAVDANTRLIFLANPNNPTGTFHAADAIERFLDKLPDHVIVALDEAYIEFAERFAVERGAQIPRSVDYVREGRNVVVMRTFSKAQGLAAVRAGYGIGPAELIGYLARLKTAFMVSTPAQAAAMAALDDHAHFEKTMRNNLEQSRWLTAQMHEIGLNPVESWTNFIYCEVGESASLIGQKLQQEGVIIRPLTGSWGAPTAIRVTVGTPDENQRFIDALKKTVGNRLSEVSGK